MLYAVPGHDDWVLSPYARDRPAYAERCRKLGERCGVGVEVELVWDDAVVTENFWTFFRKVAGGVPGQQESWRGGNQWTTPCNAYDDFIGLYVGNPDLLWLYIRTGDVKRVGSAARMRRFSRTMRNQMADQTLSGDIDSESERGRTVRVERSWTRDNEDEWGEACQWLRDQYERLRLILTDSDREDEEQPDDA